MLAKNFFPLFFNSDWVTKTIKTVLKSEQLLYKRKG